MRSERRKFPRKKPDQLSYVNLENDNGGMLLDLSESGLGFHVVSPLNAPDEKIRFWFSVKSIDRIEASGHLIWADAARKSGGVKFVDLPESALKQIRAWLAAPASTQEIMDPTLLASPIAPEPPVSDPMSDFDARAEEVMQLAEAALGSISHGSSVPITGEADLLEPELVAAAAPAAVDASARSVGHSASNRGRFRAASANSSGLMLTSAGIQQNPKLSKAAATATPRRYSMLFDEVDSPEPEFSGSAAPFSVAPRQSQFGVVFGTLSVLLIIALGVYGYLYHDQVGSFLESLGARISNPSGATSQPATVAAAPPASSPNSTAPSADSLPLTSATSASLTPAPDAPASAPTAAQPSSPARSRKTPPVSDARLQSSSLANHPDAAAGAPPVPDGSEELAAAHRILNASGNHVETNREVQLLWSSVEKGNLTAEVELANLYISGVGVQKNCTQARILLQSAARRDSADALRRLQDLRRLGCR
jgi:hypothetical protein